MLSYSELKKIKKMYEDGENIIQYAKSNTALPAEEVIMFSYDLQAGSYIKALNENNLKKLKEEVGIKLSGILNNLGIESVCEVGVGEATTLGHVLNHANMQSIYAFDISLSRLFYGQQFLRNMNHDVSLFASEINSIPCEDSAIDCLYSYHSLEPNGGSERIILEELLRVTNRYLILIEPDYDLFGDEQKKRMTHFGYVRHLHDQLKQLDVKIHTYEPWGLDSNNLNKASIIIAEKMNGNKVNKKDIHFVSPISHAPLMKTPEGWYSREDGFLFPVVNGIPVFLKKYAILASHYHHFCTSQT